MYLRSNLCLKRTYKIRLVSMISEQLAMVAMLFFLK